MSDEQEADVADDEEHVDADAGSDEVEERSGEETEKTQDAAPETGETADVGETEDEGGIEEGDFVRIDYTARTVEDGDIVDTTDPEVAEEEGIDDQDRDIEPRVIVVGEGHIFESVEDELLGEEVGHAGSTVVPAEEAFGEYDPDEVRTVSADKIPEDDRYPGAHVEVDGQRGHVDTIIGGRARVDFNHPLAGEDVEYDYEVVEAVDDRVEQAKGLVSMFIDVDLEMWVETDEVEEEVTVEDGETPAESREDGEAGGDAEPATETQTVEKETLYIESTPQLAMNQQWMFQKQQIAQQVIDQLGLDRVIVQETIDGGGMGPMGGMMGGGGGIGADEIDDALDDADVDEEEIVEELEGELGEE